MIGAVSTRFKLAGLAAFAIVAAGCTGVVETSDLTVQADGRCTSGLGSYKLSKTYVRLKVTQDVDVLNPDNIMPYVLETIGFEKRADDRFSYCLDYLASPFSDDDIQVKRSTDTSASKQLLRIITSKAVDKTALIVRKLIRAIFIGLSQNANFSDGRSLVVSNDKVKRVQAADLQFDPFDPVEVSEINGRLRQLGFCMVLEDYTFDRRRANPSSYCSNPRGIMRSHPSVAARIVAEQQPLTPKVVEGVYYRPLATYMLSIFVKDDPGGPDAWRLAKTQAVQLENVSPVIALGVDRALFAERRTTLVFDDGVLIQTCISKNSEIEGAIQIPLDVVYGLVALPSQIMQVQIETANLNSEVIKAENNVIQAQKSLIAYKMDQNNPLPAQAVKNINTGYKDLKQPTLGNDPKSSPFAGFSPTVPTFFDPRGALAPGSSLAEICDKATVVGAKL
jgi:hypothetical protein